MYRDQPDMPTKGQFLVIWKHNHRIWSTVCRWNKYSSRFETYNEEREEEWEPGNIKFYLQASEIHYIVLEEDNVS